MIRAARLPHMKNVCDKCEISLLLRACFSFFSVVAGNGFQVFQRLSPASDQLAEEGRGLGTAVHEHSADPAAAVVPHDGKDR